MTAIADGTMCMFCKFSCFNCLPLGISSGKNVVCNFHVQSFGIGNFNVTGTRENKRIIKLVIFFFLPRFFLISCPIKVSQ